VIGLYKTELIKSRGPWRTAEQVESATLHYVDWYNHRGGYSRPALTSPAEFETGYYRQNAGLAEAG
jgi:putative transposase